MRIIARSTVIVLSLILGFNSFAQNETDGNSGKMKDLKGFHIGLFSGVLFANKYTANMYDGYGYKLDGTKNDFFDSFMYRKINFEYGGGNGQTDRIAQALNVNPGDWTFSQSDMPINMRYAIAFALGFHSRYCFNNKEALIFNVNASKLNVTGNFTISLTSPYISSQPPGTLNQRTFSIIGGEQRLLFQFGYQAIGGEEDEPLNFFIEGGPMVSMVKFDKNQIIINNIQIPLTVYYDQLGYITYRAQILKGVGLGDLDGLGINLEHGSRWTDQLCCKSARGAIN